MSNIIHPGMSRFTQALGGVGEKTQLKLGDDGGISTASKNPFKRLIRWAENVTGQNTAANQAVMTAFKKALEGTYGESGTRAFETVLKERFDSGRPLSARQANAALKTATNFDIDRAAVESTRKANRTEPVFHTEASTVTGPGMQGHAMVQGDTKAHFWHPSGEQLKGLIAKEMTAMQESGKTPDGVQARLNLVKAVLDQAYAEKADGKANVFLAPEWLFKGDPGAMTEGQMRAAVKELTAMSKDYPGMVIMPGTMLWNRPNAIIYEGPNKLPSDTLFNTAPVVADGKLVHINYKHMDGADAAEVQKENRGRAQLFIRDRQDTFRNKSEAKGFVEQASRDAEPNSTDRAWEQELYGDNTPSPYNYVFTYGGKSYALDVCADHSGKFAKEEYSGAVNLHEVVGLLTDSAQNGTAAEKLDSALSAVDSKLQEAQEKYDKLLANKGPNFVNIGQAKTATENRLSAIKLLLTSIKAALSEAPDGADPKAVAALAAKEAATTLAKHPILEQAKLFAELPPGHVQSRLEGAILHLLDAQGKPDPTTLQDFLTGSSGGVDVHLLASFGSGATPGSHLAADGGVVVQCDAVSGYGLLATATRSDIGVDPLVSTTLSAPMSNQQKVDSSK